MNKFTVIIEYGGARFEVHGTASKLIPARTNCSNDDAAPAEGGLEEVLEVHLLDKTGAYVELPEFLQDKVDERIIDKALADDDIWEALCEQEKDAMEERYEDDQT